MQCSTEALTSIELLAATLHIHTYITLHAAAAASAVENLQIIPDILPALLLLTISADAGAPI